MFMEDTPYWQTLQWAGMITVDGQEADVDQVMSDWLEMVLSDSFGIAIGDYSEYRLTDLMTLEA